MKLFTSETQKTGKLGEEICRAYLIKKKFEIVEVNYTKSFGEIDIIAKRNKELHFIEVKSIKIKKGSHETYNPAENLTKKKYFKIYKTLISYLSEKNVSSETKWQIDLYCVYIDIYNKKHKLSKVENIIFT